MAKKRLTFQLHIGNPWPVDHLSRGFNPFVTAPVPVEFLEDLDDDSDDDMDDLDDNDDQGDQGPSDRAALFVDSRLFARSRHGRHGGNHGSTVTLKEKFEKFWTSLLLAEPASQTTATTRSKTAPKVLYLKDIADIIHTSLGSMLIPALSSAVITLRKAGHNVMIVAGHSPSLLTALHQDAEGSSSKSDGSSGGLSLDSDLADVPIITILQKLRSPAGHSHPNSSLGSNSLSSLLYESFPGPTHTFHHISIPPVLAMHTPVSGTSSVPADQLLQQKNAAENARLLRRDRAERIKEINCRNLDAVLRFRGGILEQSGSSADVFGGLTAIGNEIWGFSKVFRVISNALGSLYLSQLQQEGGSSTQAAVLTKSHLQSAMETVTSNTTLRNTSANCSWSGEKKAPKPLIRPEDCDRYERKLLNSIVDPGKDWKIVLCYCISPLGVLANFHSTWNVYYRQNQDNVQQCCCTSRDSPRPSNYDHAASDPTSIVFLWSPPERVSFRIAAVWTSRNRKDFAGQGRRQILGCTHAGDQSLGYFRHVRRRGREERLGHV